MSAISGSQALDGSTGFRDVIWWIRVSNLDWVFTSRACNSERACSRDVMHLFSIVSNGMVLGDLFSMMAEEESSAGKYMECEESVLVLGVLGLWNMTMVDLPSLDWSSRGDPFRM